MENKEKQTEKDDESIHKITQDDFNEFMQAETYEERLKILLAHSQKNSRRIEIRRAKRMKQQAKTQKEVEEEMLELNRQFGEFLHTKGITAKFSLAFGNMGESARKQHVADVRSYEAVKAQSAEDNKEFVEFLHTKGVKAKFHLVTENIKKGADAAPQNTAAQIAKIHAQTQASIAQAHAYAYGNPYVSQGYTAKSLADEFNAFLKEKGLDKEYTVIISEKDS